MGKVERMGGKVSGWLKGNVTHLVVKEVGSVKYFSAAHVNIPVMVVDWIEHLWKHGQSRYFVFGCICVEKICCITVCSIFNKEWKMFLIFISVVKMEIRRLNSKILCNTEYQSIQIEIRGSHFSFAILCYQKLLFYWGISLLKMANGKNSNVQFFLVVLFVWLDLEVLRETEYRNW